LTWHYAPGDERLSGYPVISWQNMILVRSESDLIALFSDGKVNWIFGLTTGDRRDKVVSNPALGPDGTVYIGTNHYLYALEPRTGRIHWRIAFESRSNVSSVYVLAIDADGSIFAIIGGDNVAAIRPNGTVARNIEQPGIQFSSLAFAGVGMLYICSIDGFVHAISED
jgi:outer membrane protein assembly factor BamB